MTFEISKNERGNHSTRFLKNSSQPKDNKEKEDGESYDPLHYAGTRYWKQTWFKLYGERKKKHENGHNPVLHYIIDSLSKLATVQKCTCKIEFSLKRHVS